MTSARIAAGKGRYAAVQVSGEAAAETPQGFPAVEATVADADLGEGGRRAIAHGAARTETLDALRGSSWDRTEMVRASVRRALESARLGAASAAGAVA